MSIDLTRRGFLQTGALGLAAVACSNPAKFAAPQDRARVVFTRDISAAGLLNAYSNVTRGIVGRVGIKLHTGERHGPNILPRDMVKALQQEIHNSNLVETNTLYKGDRTTTADHRETIKINGWDFCPVDIMDEEGAARLPVLGGKHFTEMSVGSHLLDYDSLVVLTHFKGHASGGFGGSMKNIAIGCADALVGKRMLHGAAATAHVDTDTWLKGSPFQENMVVSAKATADHFAGRIVYLNVLRNMSVDCDCAGLKAAPVKARDIGILASTDLLAIDQASIDLVYKLPEAELHDLKERIETREGLRQLSYMKEMKMGNADYAVTTL
jgi:hypothetical protein